MKQNSLKLTPGMILRRGHYAYFFYYWLYGLIADHRLAGRSLSRTVFNDEASAFPVQSISYPYIKELEKHLALTTDDVFVDVGCAWGRLLGYLRRHTKADRMIGVELNTDAAAFAQRIFQSDDNVEIISGSILTSFPEQGTVFYLFNPFDESVLSRLIRTMEQTVSHPVRLLYLHPTCRHILDNAGANWTLTKEVQIKPRHLGPLTLCIYEYCPG